MTEFAILPSGSVLAELIKTYPELKVTALVRNPSHIKAVRDLGVEVVQGGFSDADLISSHVRAADITFNSADSDDVALHKAILAGQRARVVDDGKPPPIFLHTSGVAVFMDGGKEGKHDPNSKVWNVRLQIAGTTCAFGRSGGSPVPYRMPMKPTSVVSLPRCCTAKSTHRRSFF